eukprot:TRINITY_DN4890_c0_g1_i3.p1 TRINITY_DN4890_c0_g1~~TRINITY_DN4890_c0_g1_i3.p1  ORF type:complete len:173 (+),score=24.57 TRINITY_DN4890_c0_g1_i3:800-1318(+)
MDLRLLRKKKKKLLNWNPSFLIVSWRRRTMVRKVFLSVARLDHQKDSQVSRSRCREILISELTPGASSNDKLTALLKAALGGMRSRTAKEAIQLLTTSERIYEDLSFELENSSKFHQFIIVREWKNIPVEHEYRGFVCGKKLNAISQFCHLLLLFPGCHYSCHLQVHDFHNK